MRDKDPAGDPADDHADSQNEGLIHLKKDVLRVNRSEGINHSIE